MDLEGYAKNLISKKDQTAHQKIKERMIEFKKIDEECADSLVKAVFEETQSALSLKGDLFEYYKSGVTMGDFGIGSRGEGDFYAHEKIGRVIGKTNAVLDSSHLDDSGVVEVGDNSDYLVVTVDGMHSRLSAFPFLAGFHVAKAALRDIYVMGAKPAAMLSDIHVADDGDASMIFDHLAGISTVSELTDIPLVTGSTLRIGGDMVIGERMTGCVGAVGTVCASDLTARNQAAPGDSILMTRGTGGGTITTAAIYSGYPDAEKVIEKTLNVDFLRAAQALLDSKNILNQIHVMTDVTNGGVRGDAFEISKEANVRLVFNDDSLEQCVEPAISNMLADLGIDFRGVSIDSLLVICPPEISGDILQIVQNSGVFMTVVGHVEEKNPEKYDTALIVNGEEKEFKPLFRESAYTPLKKAIGEKKPSNFNEMKKEIDAAANAAIEKKKRILERIQNKN